MIRFPFDWKNPWGFLLTAIITFALIQFILWYAAHIISYAIGMDLYTVSLAEDIRRHLKVINGIAKTGTIDRMNIHRQFSEYNQFHSNAKQLSKK